MVTLPPLISTVGFVKTGDGMLVLRGASEAFTGEITISAGALRLAGQASRLNGAAGVTITEAGGTFSVAGFYVPAIPAQTVYRGALTLWGRSAEDHLLFAEHLTAEYRVKTEGRGRRVDEWKMRPDAHDNHWWDCIVGSAVAASMSGCVLAGTMADGRPRTAAKPKVKLSELRRMRR